MKLVRRLIRGALDLLFGRENISPPRIPRINIPRFVLQRLMRLTRPTTGRVEPLALAVVRYASEDAQDVVVVVDCIAFADEAYVDGLAGTNFDTRWLMSIANSRAASNSGLLLVHCHDGTGKPAFSAIDRKTNNEGMATLAVGMTTIPYGALVLSSDDYYAIVTMDGGLTPARVMIVPDAGGRLDLSA